MKYRIINFALCLLFVFGMTNGARASAAVRAVKSSQPIFADNVYAEMTAYNIAGSNYVRLRDIGKALDFDVFYEKAYNVIHIFTDRPYSGGLFTVGQTPETAEVAETEISIFVDGWAKTLVAYNIGGNNYVKLRDVGAMIDFSVEWNEANEQVLIDTAKPYTPEAASGAATVPAPALTIDEMKAEIVRLTNIERISAGARELDVLPELMDCAQAKAQDFIDSNYYGHDSPVYGTAAKMIRSFVPSAGWCAENIAPWRATHEEVVCEWLDSPGHRKNMLNEVYTHIGVGIVEGANGGYWWVVQFVQLQQ